MPGLPLDQVRQIAGAPSAFSARNRATYSSGVGQWDTTGFGLNNAHVSDFV